MQDTLIEEVWLAMADAHGSTHALDELEWAATFIIKRLRKGGTSDAVIRNVLCDPSAKEPSDVVL